MGITKRGDSYARTLLIEGARAVLRAVKYGHAPLGAQGAWLARLVDRRGTNRVCVGLANKTARIVWRVLAYGSLNQVAV